MPNVKCQMSNQIQNSNAKTINYKLQIPNHKQIQNSKQIKSRI